MCKAGFFKKAGHRSEYAFRDRLPNLPHPSVSRTWDRRDTATTSLCKPANSASVIAIVTMRISERHLLPG